MNKGLMSCINFHVCCHYPHWLLCGGIRFDDLDGVSMSFVYLIPIFALVCSLPVVV